MTKEDIKLGDRIKFKSFSEIVTIAGKSYRWYAKALADKEATIARVTNSGYEVYLDSHIYGITCGMFDKLPNQPTAI